MVLVGFVALAYTAATQGPEERYVCGDRRRWSCWPSRSRWRGARQAGLDRAGRGRRRPRGRAARLPAGRAAVRGARLARRPRSSSGWRSARRRCACRSARAIRPRSLAILAGIGAVGLVLLARRRAAGRCARARLSRRCTGGAAGHLRDEEVHRRRRVSRACPMRRRPGSTARSAAAPTWRSRPTPPSTAAPAAILREVCIFNRSTGCGGSGPVEGRRSRRPARCTATCRATSSSAARRPLGLDATEIASTDLPAPAARASPEVERLSRGLAWAQQPAPMRTRRGALLRRACDAFAAQCSVPTDKPQRPYVLTVETTGPRASRRPQPASRFHPAGPSMRACGSSAALSSPSCGMTPC